VKPNREELARTLGSDLSSDDDLKDAMTRVNELGAEWIVVSHGEKPLWAGSRGKFYVFHPPRIEAVNPIASGDCLAAGIACGLHRNLEMCEAIRYGIAAAAENATMLLPARIAPDRVDRHLSSISLRQL
jgi:fructose-1-phosphate kinase PfkB-like protein